MRSMALACCLFLFGAVLRPVLDHVSLDRQTVSYFCGLHETKKDSQLRSPEEYLVATRFDDAVLCCCLYTVLCMKSGLGG